MDNYNFTKGKWSLGDKRKSYQFIDCKDQGWYEMARVIVKLDGELSIEGKANALLISRAPEMLEELHDTIDDLKLLKSTILDASKTNMKLESVVEVIQNWIDRKKQLIKEATEI